MKRYEKGISLVALVVTVIILIIVTGVVLTVLLGEHGLINSAKDAKEKAEIGQITDTLNMYEASVQTEKRLKATLDDFFEYSLSQNDFKIEIEDNDENTTKQKYIMINDKYEYLIEERVNHDMIITYMGKIGEIEILKISPTSDMYTYPASGTFKVVKNGTGGELEVESLNSNIATASINKETKVVTVTPVAVGEAQIRVKAKQLENMKNKQQHLMHK